jgi:Flp pilus assembly protein TadG
MLNFVLLKLVAMRRDDQGIALVLFVILIMPILLIIAIAIDFSDFLAMKQQLADATDAAALVAAKNITLADSQMQTLIQSVLQANYPQAATPGTVQVTFSRPSQYSLTINVSTTMQTNFLQLAGYSSLPVNVSSTAVPAINYLNIYTLVDMSGSLGIAADANNRAQLQALTRPYTKDSHERATGCEFACHYVDGSVQLPNNQTTYDFARANGISLREDVLKSAFSNFVTDIFTTNPNNNVQTQVDVIGFSGFALAQSDPSMIQDLTNGPTSDQSTAASALSNYTGARWGAQYRWVLPMVATLMGPQGDGYTANTPLKLLVLITDGVENDRNVYIRPGPIDMPINFSNIPTTSPANCDAIKNSGGVGQGIPIAVIDIQYLYSPNDYWFQYWLGTLISAWNSTVYGEVSPALQQCASPGWYFQAGDSDQIETALNQLLAKINTSRLRLIK